MDQILFSLQLDSTRRINTYLATMATQLNSSVPSTSSPELGHEMSQSNPPKTDIE